MGATGHGEGKQRSERDREPLDDLHCAPPPHPDAKGLGLNALLDVTSSTLPSPCGGQPRQYRGSAIRATSGGTAYSG